MYDFTFLKISKLYYYFKIISISSITVHPLVPDALMITPDPHSLDMPLSDLHIYVDRLAGRAIMRGSHLYAPGILGSNRGWV
jgi:predicted ribosome-associated RNA-binding protein Tma20